MHGLCYDCGQKKAKEHIKLSMEEVTKRINSVNNNKLLNPSEYIDNSTINLKILCGECNKNIFITSLANYEYNQKIRCGTCSQRISVPERTTRNILEKYDITKNHLVLHLVQIQAESKTMLQRTIR